MSFAIVTDTAANLPQLYLNRHDITTVPFTFLLDGKEFDYTCPDTFDSHTYYDAIRAGARVTTSQINPDRYMDYMRPILERGKNILFVGVSSGVSGAFSSAQLAATQLREEFPERTIRLVDSLSAALGEGLLVLKAALCRNEGLNLENTARQLEEFRTRIYHLFTVDDLQHLNRSGRISGLTAAIGTVLGIKPLLKGSDEGKIVASDKARGRKKVMNMMVQKYAALVSDAKSHLVAISHADCLDDAEKLADMIRAECDPQDVIVTRHEPATGGHIGPGALALFFVGAPGVRKK
ncbi:MAG: DegV family protein [Clostridia bacterium]|nr:DegV family protein [Clostridia bacterium]